MTFSELKQKAIDQYYPALFLERIMPHHIHNRLRKIVWVIFSFLFFILAIALGFSHTSSAISVFIPKVYGLFFLSLPVGMILLSLQAFYYSFVFKDDSGISFELAHIVYRSSMKDPVKGFLRTRLGRLFLYRAGIADVSLKNFLRARKNIVTGTTLIVSDAEFITMADYVDALVKADADFAHFLFKHEIQPKDAFIIAQWVAERELSLKDTGRWWTKDRLARIPGIGKQWAYGDTFYLDHYALNLPKVSVTGVEVHTVYGTEELKLLEQILVKEKGANALLIGNDKEGQLQILARLQFMIEEGLAFPEIEHKRIVLFDTELLISTTKTKAEFEAKLLQIMYEAVAAGNVIIAIADFPGFITSAEALGADIVSLLDRFLTSPVIHIVALADTSRFHAKLESNVGLTQRFEKIIMKDIDESNTVRVLENEIIPIEHHYHLFFTYASLVALSESATRFFPDAMMPETAINLLVELAPMVYSKGRHMIRKKDVMELVKVKTGISTGTVDAGERDKLINLEKILHQRVIGQDEAIEAIANAVRRARSGINNPNRPLGSFLFLGPTGVGKTETTKALAEVFFGSEAKVERLDMSEYSGADALSKLIGAFESGKPGVLSSMIREHPYGVLLLDEFEKTTKEVMNLFLQVLDEGFFSDMSGKKLNARNLLIIATSNAGADIIWQGLQSGDDFSQAKDYIINEIIRTGAFKPELVNRFDGVIVFHPLGKDQLRKVAELQLGKLQKRLAERGFNLIVNDALVNYVMQFGVDPKFGARPMNRAVQDKVEQIIADKMIRGLVKPGSDIELSTTDLVQNPLTKPTGRI